MDELARDLGVQLHELEQALRKVEDLGTAEDLLTQRDAVTRRLEAVSLVADNRARAGGLDGWKARLTALRAQLATLLAQREELEGRLHQAVRSAEREAPTEALKALAWSLPHIRVLAAQRDQVVANLATVEAELKALERPAEEGAVHVRV